MYYLKNAITINGLLVTKYKLIFEVTIIHLMV